MTFLEGKKTFLICLLAIVYALSAYFTGHIDANSMIETILAALGVAGLRNAIK